MYLLKLHGCLHDADDDYSDMPVPVFLTLDVNNTLRCTSIIIYNDSIVEGEETFEVQFHETDDNQIEIVGSNTVPVTITDDDG